ncbi:MAG: hypothetical protein GY774_09020 [Planctomycetes bacterium]|nr:hypothetical protein [Planctomycetota bacterium]
MPSQTEITKGVFIALEAVSGLPCIAMPNVDFNPDEHIKYVAAFILPAESDNETMGCDSFSGLIQTSVYIRDGRGIVEATTYSDMIRAAFPKGLEITNGDTSIVISKTGWDSPMIVEQGWCQIPVTIPYKSIN